MPPPPRETKKVLNTLVLEEITDDPSKADGLVLVGTLVQRVYGLRQEDVDEGFCFGYRFHEKTPHDDELELRKTAAIPEFEVDAKPKHRDGSNHRQRVLGTRSTFQVQIPLKIEILYPIFPIPIQLATAKIELSYDREKNYLPDLLLHKDCRRLAVNIQAPKEKNAMAMEAIGIGAHHHNNNESPPSIEDRIRGWIFGKKENHRRKQREHLKQVWEAIDQSSVYDFLSPHPLVCYRYHKHNPHSQNSCPMFELSFCVVKRGFERWVKLVLPMVLVTMLALLNTYNDLQNGTGFVGDNNDYAPISAVAHLSVTSTLTLAVVFVLPQTLGHGNRAGSLLTSQDRFAFVFFSGLVLSCIPLAMFGTAIPELLGVALMGLSLLAIPVRDIAAYYGIQKRILGEATAQHQNPRHRFVSSGFEDHRFGDLRTIGELFHAEDLDETLYRRVRGEDHEDCHRLCWELLTTTKTNRGKLKDGDGASTTRFDPSAEAAGYHPSASIPVHDAEAVDNNFRGQESPRTHSVDLEQSKY